MDKQTYEQLDRIEIKINQLTNEIAIQNYMEQNNLLKSWYNIEVQAKGAKLSHLTVNN